MSQCAFVQAGADFVWANDAWDETHGPLVANLSAASGDPWGFQGPVDAWQTKHASASVEGAASAGPGGEGAEWAERQESHSRASTTGDVRAEGDDDRQNVGGGKWKSEGHLSPGMRGENGRDRLEGAACNESESEGSQHEDDSESAATRQHTRSQNGHAGLGEAASGTDVDPLPEVQGPQREPRWRVSHLEATKLLNSCNQNDDFYDIVDIDSFGSDSAFLGDALRAVRFGGMVYATSTDGFALAGGHRPAATLAAYGSYARPVPFGNELGLRILVGTMVRVEHA